MASHLSRVVLGAGLAAVVMLCAPAIAEAQGGPKATPSAADKQAAKKLVDDGIAAQNAKDYDTAIELYQKAYDLVPHPALLFNIGLAHKLAGRFDKATTFYERYLALEPNGAQAPDARAALAAMKAGAAETSPRESVRPAVDADPPATDPATPEHASKARMPEPEDSPRAARPGRTLRITGLVLVGLGAVSAAVGGYYTTRVLALEDEAATRDAMGAPLDDVGQRGIAAQHRQDISYILAGSLIVGGAVTYFIGRGKDRAAPTTAFLPLVGPGLAGLSFSRPLP